MAKGFPQVPVAFRECHINALQQALQAVSWQLLAKEATDLFLVHGGSP
jgi:hypothetical protein